MGQERSGCKMKNFVRVVAVSLLLFAARKSVADCGQLSVTLTNLPGIDGSGFQVNGLNSAGQLTGFFYIAGVHAGHAFVYGDGKLVEPGTRGGSFSDGLGIDRSGWIAGGSQLGGDMATHAFALLGEALLYLATLVGA